MVTGFVCGAQSVSSSNKPLSLVYELVAKFILRFFQIIMGDKSALTSTHVEMYGVRLKQFKNHL